jgi:DNA-3-methyladenine glycosylase
MLEPLPRAFFDRSADVVAVDLLGHYLVRDIEGESCGGLIVETEAYLSQDDASMWAYQRETARNRVLFGPPGHFYIYRVYRLHALLNVSCREEGIAEAVLVRAIEPTFGEGVMRRFRPANTARELTNGPSKLCAALDIGPQHSGADACDVASPLIYARNPQRETDAAARGPMVRTTRIGLSRGAELPLRFYLGGSAWVSKKAQK